VVRWPLPPHGVQVKILCPFARPSPIAGSTWGRHILDISYITRYIDGFHVIVGDWYAVVVEIWERDVAKKGIVLRHKHTANLTAATVRVDNRQWMCYTCGEEVPKSVLFELTFRGIGKD